MAAAAAAISHWICTLRTRPEEPERKGQSPRRITLYKQDGLLTHFLQSVAPPGLAKSQPASAESLGKPSGFELCYGGWNFVEEGKVIPEKTKYGRA